MEELKPDVSGIEGSNYMEAIGSHISDVWLDGNEEIVMVEAACPNEGCGRQVISFFTMPRSTSKVQECRFCKTKMVVSLPAA